VVEDDFPKLSDYCFSVDVRGLMYAMKDLGDKGRWPKKDNKTGWKDKSKWCAFHDDFGHTTEDCIALRKEIAYLLSKVHLKDLLGKKKSIAQDGTNIPERAASPPKDDGIISFISGGSDI